MVGLGFLVSRVFASRTQKIEGFGFWEESLCPEFFFWASCLSLSRNLQRLCLLVLDVEESLLFLGQDVLAETFL